jgi:hypothetical protein
MRCSTGARSCKPIAAATSTFCANTRWVETGDENSVAGHSAARAPTLDRELVKVPARNARSKSATGGKAAVLRGCGIFSP